MRTAAVGCSTVAAMLWATAAVAGEAPVAWRNARWGMTTDEVVAAFPGEAVRASRAEIEKGEAPVRIDRCEIEGTEFQATFYVYAGPGLTKIVFAPSSKTDSRRPLFDRLAKMLVDRYGQPKTDVDQSMLLKMRVAQKTWEATNARIWLSYMYGMDEPSLHMMFEAPARQER